MEMLGLNQIPFARVFTKTDKLKQSELIKSIKVHNNMMFEKWDELPQYFISSTKRKLGREEILEFIEESINIFRNVS